jgi:predicted Zn finger-like uncharacterized protein
MHVGREARAVSLVTRCPRCRTLFRVTPVQLQKRSGKVRCGRCMQTFDGFGTLAVEQISAPSTAAPTVTFIEPPAPVYVAPTPARPKPASPVLPEERPARITPVPAPAAVTPAPSEPTVGEPARKPLWATGSIVLGVLLLMQSGYVYRSELAARYPAIRSAYNLFCKITGCAVTLPQRPDLVKIEASDVHMLDTNRPGLIQLTATLRSYASYDLAYPALDLVLTNANEHALARRIFVPDEYLDPLRDPKNGIPPNAEITVALDLDTSDLDAAGFRLDLLPAPPP